MHVAARRSRWLSIIVLTLAAKHRSIDLPIYTQHSEDLRRFALPHGSLPRCTDDYPHNPHARTGVRKVRIINGEIVSDDDPRVAGPQRRAGGGGAGGGGGQGRAGYGRVASLLDQPSMAEESFGGAR